MMPGVNLFELVLISHLPIWTPQPINAAQPLPLCTSPLTSTRYPSHRGASHRNILGLIATTTAPSLAPRSGVRLFRSPPVHASALPNAVVATNYSHDGKLRVSDGTLTGCPIGICDRLLGGDQLHQPSWVFIVPG